MPSQEMSSCVAFLAGERRVPSSKFRCPRFDTCNEMLNLNWGRARVTESIHNHLRVAFQDDISKSQLPSKNCANLCSLASVLVAIFWNLLFLIYYPITLFGEYESLLFFFSSLLSFHLFGSLLFLFFDPPYYLGLIIVFSHFISIFQNLLFHICYPITLYLVR